jgi:hypothetical protein
LWGIWTAPLFCSVLTAASGKPISADGTEVDASGVLTLRSA